MSINESLWTYTRYSAGIRLRRGRGCWAGKIGKTPRSTPSCPQNGPCPYSYPPSCRQTAPATSLSALVKHLGVNPHGLLQCPSHSPTKNIITMQERRLVGERGSWSQSQPRNGLEGTTEVGNQNPKHLIGWNMPHGKQAFLPHTFGTLV